MRKLPKETDRRMLSHDQRASVDDGNRSWRPREMAWQSVRNFMEETINLRHASEINPSSHNDFPNKFQPQFFHSRGLSLKFC